jgi:hypothetical protein
MPAEDSRIQSIGICSVIVCCSLRLCSGFIERRPHSVAVAGLANRLACIIWAVLAKGHPYDRVALHGALKV